MSFSFGKSSLDNLLYVHKDIKTILNEVIKIYDFSVISGLRTTEEQQQLFKEGKTKLDGINEKSKHQGRPSKEGLVSFAVDIVPYKKGLNPFENTDDNYRRYYFLMGLIFATSNSLLEQNKISHKVRFGLDWQMNMTYNHKHEFFDAPHFELVSI